MNVKNKVLLIVTGVILTLSGFYLLQGIARHNEALDAAIQDEESTIDAMVGDIERYTYALYRSRLRNLMEEHPELVRAFAERDRERLYELTLPLFTRRRTENRYLHAWDFNLPDGTVFLRVQDPAAFGDNLGPTREMIQAVHETKEPIAGFDVGRHGAIYWVARPVFDQGRYVGATELGLEAEQLTESLTNRFKTQVALTVRTADWQKASLVGKEYRRVGDQVLIAPADSRYRRIPDEAILAGKKDVRLGLGGEEYVLHKCAVLRDFRGKPIGSVLVLQDITEKIAHKRRFVLGATAVTGLLLLVSFSVLYASFGTLIGRLQDYAAENKRAREEIEKANSELERRVLLRTAELQNANETLAREATERVEMDKALWDSHDRLLRVLDGLDAVVYVADLATHEVLFANQFARNTFGELVGKKCWETIQSGQSGPCPFCTNRSLVGPDGQSTGGSTWEFRNAALGKWYAIRERAIPWVDNRLVRLAIATDITERKQAEDAIRTSLREQGLLLKEVHHRVKNNMQIVSSLLRLQADCTDAGSRSEDFRECQGRIQAMALIHEKLYLSGDISRVDMGDYLRSLVERLNTAYGHKEGKVRTRVDADHVQLSIDTAVLAGLVVNELVTNSLKYAFPDGRGGTVDVGLARLGAGEGGEVMYEITVRDDGTGMPEGVVPGQTKTLGLQLVMLLVEQQLQGTVTVHRGDGTGFAIRFRELSYGTRT